MLYRQLTVARTRKTATHIEAMFYESPRIFCLSEDMAARSLEKLSEGEQVLVGVQSLDSHVILDIREPEEA